MFLRGIFQADHGRYEIKISGRVWQTLAMLWADFSGVGF